MKHAKKMYLTTALVLALAFSGCNQKENKAENAAPETKPAAVANQETKDSAVTGPATAEAAVPAAIQEKPVVSQEVFSGKVLETFDSGGYTYMQLDKGGEKVWAAIGQAKVAVGDTINLQGGPVMRDFHSKTLDRTFPEIIFSSGLAGADAGVKADPHAGMGNFSQALKSEGKSAAMPPAEMGGGADATGGSLKAVTPQQEIKVEKADGANGYRVEELFASAGNLAGKKVKIRGKVVKVSPGIMGRTWIHLQDGTGNPMKNTHDLVVTSADVPEMGSIIVVEGELAKDKDFGAGYFYNVIVEKATVGK